MSTSNDPNLRSRVELRDVTEDDLPIFFEQQLDKLATDMAAFPSQELAPFMAHWQKILSDRSIAKRTVVFDGDVAGNIVAYGPSKERCVGYWMGRAFWGQGVATAALRLFLDLEKTRPLFAFVAAHNAGSLRVLAKCGFVQAKADEVLSSGFDDDTEEILMTLRPLNSDH
jgi:RimJ/RimL family protein N-acetyltransferase